MYLWRTMMLVGYAKILIRRHQHCPSKKYDLNVRKYVKK